MQHSSRKSALGITITMVLVAVVVAILVLFTIQGRNLRQEVSESKVSEATRAVREKFLEISAHPKGSVPSRKMGRSSILDIRKTRQLNDKFMPLLESQAMVSSLILADTDGREYFLLREGASWLTRSSEEFRSGMQVNLNRWSTAGDLLKTWRENRTFDPRNRSWFAGALQLTGSGTIFWTEPYRFKTVNKLGITASVRWQTKSDDRVITVAALDILLDDLYRFLAGLQVSPGARILMIRNDGSLMVPRKANQSQKAADSHDVSFISSGDLERRLIQGRNGRMGKGQDGNIYGQTVFQRKRDVVGRLQTNADRWLRSLDRCHHPAKGSDRKFPTKMAACCSDRSSHPACRFSSDRIFDPSLQP